MDLGTVAKKVNDGTYGWDKVHEFEDDVRLVFDNCASYNPPGSDAATMGKMVEDEFNKKWIELGFVFKDASRALPKGPRLDVAGATPGGGGGGDGETPGK
jgi:hypothetical protein